MPKKLEKRLKAKAKKKFPEDKKRQNAYVYGILRKAGWKPSEHHSASDGEFLEERKKKLGAD